MHEGARRVVILITYNQLEKSQPAIPARAFVPVAWLRKMYSHKTVEDGI